MKTELQPFTVPDIQQMAASVAKSRLFGMDEAQAFTLMLLAQSEGIHPVKAVQRYHIVQGRPAMKADAMLADFQLAGGTVQWITESDDREKCEALFSHPKHAPAGKTIRFSLNDAKAAGLTNKDVWKQYPASMMRARVVSIGIRMIMPGIVAGLYTPEEMSDSAITIDVTPQLPAPREPAEQHAVNHDNQASGRHPEADVIRGFDGFLDAMVEQANAGWIESITSKKTGERISAEGEIVNRWQLREHLHKWARSLDWIRADVPLDQKHMITAMVWNEHMAEFSEETQRYCRGLWQAAFKAARAKKTAKRDTPEVLELRDQDEGLDAMLETTEAGARG